MDIRHHKTLLHHPQGNGMAERFVYIVKNYLVRYLVGRNQSDWEDILPGI